LTDFNTVTRNIVNFFGSGNGDLTVIEKDGKQKLTSESSNIFKRIWNGLRDVADRRFNKGFCVNEREHLRAQARQQVKAELSGILGNVPLGSYTASGLIAPFRTTMKYADYVQVKQDAVLQAAKQDISNVLSAMQQIPAEGAQSTTDNSTAQSGPEKSREGLEYNELNQTLEFYLEDKQAYVEKLKKEVEGDINETLSNFVKDHILQGTPAMPGTPGSTAGIALPETEGTNGFAVEINDAEGYDQTIDDADTSGNEGDFTIVASLDAIDENDAIDDEDEGLGDFETIVDVISERDDLEVDDIKV
jgi:hypothetical protein